MQNGIIHGKTIHTREKRTVRDLQHIFNLTALFFVRAKENKLLKDSVNHLPPNDRHTHTHTYIYIYIYRCEVFNLLTPND
jgi:hypothetical protein